MCSLGEAVVLAADILLTAVIISSDGPKEASQTPLGEVADNSESIQGMGRVGRDQECKNTERKNHF